ncbi:MAG: hypothetical protein ABI954_04505, partial [Pyrinomonadaceae bacterium]
MIEAENERNRRKRERLHLSLPIRVQYQETVEEKWEETTRLIDITPFGAGFALSRSVEIGRLIQLIIPMPRLLRCYDHLEQQYRVWGLVRHVRSMSANESLTLNASIGVAFIGKNTPIGYAENPKQIYEIVETDELGFWRLREIKDVDENGKTSKSAINFIGTDVRQFSRLPISINVTIEVFNERGETIASEMTTTENLSETGASVFTS